MQSVRYNSTILPIINTEGPAHLIMKNGEDYFLFSATNPLVQYNGKISLVGPNSCTASVLSTDGKSWVSARSYDVPDEYVMTVEGSWTWSNHHIYQWTLVGMEKDDEGNWKMIYGPGDLVYEGSDAEPVATVFAYGINDGGTIREGDILPLSTQAPQIAGENVGKWHSQLELICYVEVEDGSKIEVEWYLGETQVRFGTSYTGKAYSRYKPPVDTLGTFVYHAVVHRVNGSERTSLICKDITITVIEYDFPNWDQFTGTDNSGVLPDFIIDVGPDDWDYPEDDDIGEYPEYPEDEYPEYPEDPEEECATPEQLRGAYWAGYATSKTLYGGGY